MEQDNIHILKKIDQYLNGQLTPDEHASFEHKIGQDEELRNLVADQRLLPNALYAIEKENLKSQVHDWLSESDNSASSTPSNLDEQDEITQTQFLQAKIKDLRVRRRYLNIAASFVLIVVAGFIYQIWAGQKDVHTLANQYLAEYHQAPVVLRGIQQNQDWVNSIDFYRQRKFSEMITTMRPIVDSGNANTEKLLYFGLAYLYQEPSEKDSCLTYFEKVLERDSETYQATIDWYTTLIHIENGSFEQANQLLGKLQSKSSIYSERAKILKKSME